MFWDRVAAPYDLFETIYNGKVYRGTGEAVAKEIEPCDVVLECACGTGAISVYIAPVCAKLIATDYSKGMLRQTAKKAGAFPNMRVKRADMTNLKCRDNRFDKVVAGNVILFYRAFFRDMGYEDVSYRVIDGRMPCMIAVIRK